MSDMCLKSSVFYKNSLPRILSTIVGSKSLSLGCG